MAWLAVVGLVFAFVELAGWLDLQSMWSHPVAADLAVAMLTVVPVLAYLIATEAGPLQATWGKRRSGLRVVADDATAPRVVRLLVRNGIKLAPWQLGHMAAVRFASDDAPRLAFALVCFAASMTALTAVAGPAMCGRRGVHDLVACTRVVSAAERRPARHQR